MWRCGISEAATALRAALYPAWSTAACVLVALRGKAHVYPTHSTAGAPSACPTSQEQEPQGPQPPPEGTHLPQVPSSGLGPGSAAATPHSGSSRVTLLAPWNALAAPARPQRVPPPTSCFWHGEMPSLGLPGRAVLAMPCAHEAYTSRGMAHSVRMRVAVRASPPGASVEGQGLHGMVSVMTAAESARDLLNAVLQPVAYTELAAHLARDYSVELFEALSGLVVCHVDELSGPELSNLLWAYATVDHHDTRLMAAVVQSLVGKLPDLGSQQLANAVWAVSRLGLYECQFVTAAVEQVWDGLPEATPRQLATFVQSYLWFRQQDQQLEEDDDLLRGIAARFRTQLSSASASEIALLLSGMAYLRRTDVALLDEACAALRSATAGADLRVLAEVTWACALLQHRDLPLLEFVADRVTEVLRHATWSSVPPTSGGSAGKDSQTGSARLRGSTAGGVHMGPGHMGRSGRHAVAGAVAAHLGGNERMPSSVRGQDTTRQTHQDKVQPHVASDLGTWSSRGTAAGPSGRAARMPEISAHDGAPSQAQGSEQKCAGANICSNDSWRTSGGPWGFCSAGSLYDRFNPALPDEADCSKAAVSTGGVHLAGASGSPACTAAGAVGTGAGALTAGVPSGAGHRSGGGHVESAAAASTFIAPPADAAALLDGDVVSKLLWSYGALQCYSQPLYTLLFRQLVRVHDDSISWSTLARLMGAQMKALELQPSHGISRINPLEAESASAWGRFLRIRPPAHTLPERLAVPAFVAFQAGECGGAEAGSPASFGPPVVVGEHAQHHAPGAPLSRTDLEAEVAATLTEMGLDVRPSATIDGMFQLPHTAMINGLSVCVEVLSASCCSVDVPYRPLGPAAARIRSLEFRGWKPLLVPFHEWDALSMTDGMYAAATPQQASAAGVVDLVASQPQQAASATPHQQYLRRKLEELIGEELPPLPQKPAKWRMR